ncbi:formate dehydrogenase accessory protein FdhE [Curtanaerobium respiraculi]|uniref:formate dehydrogenase accessory protein FdhE n=1 Tax=Curtanaerobium respiraculi TaxID=2949669 RepID=UPI0024B3846E|nr:formate dehydrogenase accessory protein FdhE [Curtanaerobium respiraculi]
MDLKLVHAAAEAYRQGALASDAARLAFFEGLYDIVQRRADAIASQGGWSPLSGEEAVRLYEASAPVFSQAPVSIDGASFAETCAPIAHHIAEHAGIVSEAARALASYDWRTFCERADLALAGSDPASFVEECIKTVDAFDVPIELSATIFMMVPAFALRAHLQPAAEQAVEAYRRALSDDKRPAISADCPVCGSPASASWVGNTGATDGRGRMLYCAACGTQWDFDRIRCDTCGTRNEGKLHYVNVEGDRAHRLLKCEECGAYQRVVFQDDLKVHPMVMEVEDVVMSKLDQIALAPYAAKLE